jgi:anti-sigma regulatory factor (Ser/Thr protein kinase)
MTTNLVERPVDGSMVLSRLPRNPQPRAAWLGYLAVSKNAPEQARYQTGWFLRKNQDAPDDDLIDTAVLLVCELVTNAYSAMTAYDALADQAPRGTIDFSLRLFDDRLLIEVIDSSSKVPVNKGPVDAAVESGRGLYIVEAVSDDWGYFFYRGRKVVFAVLPIESDAEAS